MKTPQTENMCKRCVDEEQNAILYPSCRFCIHIGDKMTQQDNFRQKKSEFKEWHDKEGIDMLEYYNVEKEGWNGFANVLSEWIEKEGIPNEVNAVGILQKIKEMREP